MTASARHGDIELIAVAMHSKDKDTRFIDAKELLDYGFESIEKIHREEKKTLTE